MNARDVVQLVPAALLTLAFACDGGDGGGAKLTPTSSSTSETVTSRPQATLPLLTPTLKPTDLNVTCPVQPDVCAMARTLAPLVATRDADAIIAESRPVTVTCPHVDEGFRPRVCAGLPEGATADGYSVTALQSEGTVMSGSDLHLVLEEWFNEAHPLQSDELGSGDWRLATVGCGTIRRDNVDTVSCDVRFGVVFSGIDGNGTRVLMEFVIEQAPDPAIQLFVHGLASINEEFVTGGHNVLPLRFDIEDRNGTDYFPVRTSAD